jgi:RNA-splicing ligase RtcB
MNKNIKVFAGTIDATTVKQIEEMGGIFNDEKIRIMPDCHAGSGCTIGTTMQLKDKVSANFVGVDIGCGMSVVELNEKEIDFDNLDKTIRKNVPSGFSVKQNAHENSAYINTNKLYCKEAINCKSEFNAIGSLGGGNHFIEIDKDNDNNLYLVIHTGSRNLGLQVANYYTNLSPVLLGENFEKYIHDMKIMQEYAVINRKTIIQKILNSKVISAKKNDNDLTFECIHNYINLNDMIMRKGAISSHKGELCYIPFSMKDGGIIGIGKGNVEWNNSAPHGAGRVMSRSIAKKTLNLEKYKNEMSGIWTSCVSNKTIDEAPEVYKNPNEIIDLISPTVEIKKRIYPIYNFKAN